MKIINNHINPRPNFSVLLTIVNLLTFKQTLLFIKVILKTTHDFFNL